MKNFQKAGGLAALVHAIAYVVSLVLGAVLIFPVLGADPSQYLFWDDIHPSSAGHALLGGQLTSVVVPEPATAVLVLAGIVVGLFARRRIRL